jgi:hypothetical protein
MNWRVKRLKDKYEFMLSLKLLDYEIKELTVYAREYRECFELLKSKLDVLCQFMKLNENIKQWSLWGNHREVKEHSEVLRETSVKALCDVEKYQSIRIYNKECGENVRFGIDGCVLGQTSERACF